MRMFTSRSIVLKVLAAMSCLSGCSSVPDEGNEGADLDVVHAKLELTPTSYPGAIRIDAASAGERCMEAIKRCQKKCDDSCGESGRGCSSITTSSPSAGCACLEWRCTSGPKTDLLEPAVFQMP
jgi:hypothetical protein